MNPSELANQLDTDFRASCARLNRDDPWFGRFTLRNDKGQKEYRVGAKRVPDERIIDWRHPLARAYYEAEPGEEFELDQPGFVRVMGVVDVLATLTTEQRSVRQVALRSQTGQQLLVATTRGFEAPEAEWRGPTQADGLPDVLSLLTPTQYRLITASRQQPVIIQGRAGSGKTTVALYRVAWLTFADEQATEAPIDPAKVLIVMFNKALSTFVRSGLAPLKLEAARLDTFHGWALEELRRSYRGAIEPDTTARPGRETASVLKKQLGMLGALEAFVAQQTDKLEHWLAEKLAPYHAAIWMQRYRELDTPVVRRLVALRGQALSLRDAAQGLEQERLTQVHAIFDTAVRRMTQYKEELLRFLTDSALLAKHLPIASESDLKTLATFQKALQGDGGSERRPGPNVAFEDFALLLRLIQLKNGGFPDKTREDDVRIYDHLMIDEAQDFGAVELTALLASVRSRTGVTIVGDLNQKILPDADFIGWDALAAELGVTGAAVARLEVVHRSTSSIMRVADSILDEPSEPERSGPKPTLWIAQTDDAMLARTTELARAAYEENRTSHVCIVCRTSSDAASLRELLAHTLSELDVPVRLGHSRHFVFAPGITVSSSRQVKGLEFDTVIVFDPSEKDYPADTDGRRALYMVVTRAKARLHFVSGRDTTELLSGAIRSGLIERVQTPTVPPVQFTEEDENPF
jgi:DNA helicase IV